MKVKVLRESDILPNNFPLESTIAARRIWRQVKVDYVGAKHVGFKVYDPIKKTEHSVIYYSEKKFPNNWSCDCKWFSIKGKYCKHILAVHIFVQRMEDILPFEVMFVKLKSKINF